MTNVDFGFFNDRRSQLLQGGCEIQLDEVLLLNCQLSISFVVGSSFI